MVVWRGKCDAHTVDVAESVARLATAATTTQLSKKKRNTEKAQLLSLLAHHNTIVRQRNTDKAQLLALLSPVFSLNPGALRGPQKTPLARVNNK